MTTTPRDRDRPATPDETIVACPLFDANTPHDTCSLCGGTSGVTVAERDRYLADGGNDMTDPTTATPAPTTLAYARLRQIDGEPLTDAELDAAGFTRDSRGHIIPEPTESSATLPEREGVGDPFPAMTNAELVSEALGMTPWSPYRRVCDAELRRRLATSTPGKTEQVHIGDWSGFVMALVDDLHAPEGKHQYGETYAALRDFVTEMVTYLVAAPAPATGEVERIEQIMKLALRFANAVAGRYVDESHPRYDAAMLVIEDAESALREALEAALVRPAALVVPEDGAFAWLATYGITFALSTDVPPGELHIRSGGGEHVLTFNTSTQEGAS